MTQRHITVLLADDHDMVRKGIRSILTGRADCDVVAEVEDGQAAVEAAALLRPMLAIVDINMPGVDGLAATAQIVKLGAGTKVVALSAHAEKHYIARMLAAGASGYLLKTSAARELEEAIATVMGGGVYLSPKAAEALRAADAEPDPAVLTERELEVLRLLADGQSSREIADALYLSHRTVESHRSHIMDKLDIRSIAGLTRYALRYGLVKAEGKSGA